MASPFLGGGGTILVIRAFSPGRQVVKDAPSSTAASTAASFRFLVFRLSSLVCRLSSLVSRLEIFLSPRPHLELPICAPYIFVDPPPCLVLHQQHREITVEQHPLYNAPPI